VLCCGVLYRYVGALQRDFTVAVSAVFLGSVRCVHYSMRVVGCCPVGTVLHVGVNCSAVCGSEMAIRCDNVVSVLLIV
jgi:hypothetical protein